MSDGTNVTPVYDDDAVARIRAFVEEVTGGRIVRMERQVRWRPAWFADVEKNGEIIELHLRGDRAGDVAIFPELKRETALIKVFFAHGIPGPKSLGTPFDPPFLSIDYLTW